MNVKPRTRQHVDDSPPPPEKGGAETGAQQWPTADSTAGRRWCIYRELVVFAPSNPLGVAIQNKFRTGLRVCRKRLKRLVFLRISPQPAS